MLEKYFHHPGIRLLIPAAAVYLVYYLGDMGVEKIGRMQVKNVAPAQKAGALPDITLPTVYVRGADKASDALSADFDRAFGAKGLEKDILAERPPAPPPQPITPPETPLISYFSTLNVNGVGSEGVFVDDVFKKWGESLPVHIPRKDGAGMRTVTLVGLGAGGVVVEVDDDKVHITPRF